MANWSAKTSVSPSWMTSIVVIGQSKSLSRTTSDRVSRLSLSSFRSFGSTFQSPPLPSLRMASLQMWRFMNSTDSMVVRLFWIRSMISSASAAQSSRRSVRMGLPEKRPLKFSSSRLASRQVHSPRGEGGKDSTLQSEHLTSNVPVVSVYATPVGTFREAAWFSKLLSWW